MQVGIMLGLVVGWGGGSGGGTTTLTLNFSLAANSMYLAVIF